MVTLLFGGTAAPAGAQANPTDDADWQLAQLSCSAEGYLWYLRRNPAGKHLAEAVTMLTALGAHGDAAPGVDCAPAPSASAPPAQVPAQAPAQTSRTGGAGGLY
jgi:hypothetical protein